MRLRRRALYQQEGKVPCPNCGYEFDSFAPSDGSGQPHLGDIGQCLECGDLHWFTAKGPVSLSRDEYVAALKASPDLRKIMEARAYVVEHHKREASDGA